jgi:LPS sulfotransferase NodH
VEYSHDLNRLLAEDAGFRGLFILLGIRPLFMTTEELVRDPRSQVRRIGETMAIPVNEDALERSIAGSAAYGHQKERERAMAGLAESFRKLPFQTRS